MTATALSLVPQINAAHQKAVNASQTPLQHAIKAGELLNTAKETVKAAKEKWLPWLKELSDIPQTTASLYMRLAANQAALDQQRVASLADEGKLSIRSAGGVLPKKPRTKPRAAAAAAKATPASVPIEERLKALAPDEVFKALTDAFDQEQLGALTDLLLEHLDKLTKVGEAGETGEGDPLRLRQWANQPFQLFSIGAPREAESGASRAPLTRAGNVGSDDGSRRTKGHSDVARAVSGSNCWTARVAGIWTSPRIARQSSRSWKSYGS